MIGRLTGNVAFITGASRGIGATIAKTLASEGCHVIIASRSTTEDKKIPGTIYSVRDEITKNNGLARAIPLDITDHNACKQAIDLTINEYGKIDYLINNASAMWWKSINETPVNRFDLLHNVNVRATYSLCHYAVPHMLNHGSGHIIVHSPPLTTEYLSKMLQGGWMNNRVAYTSSKVGMSLVAMALAEELANTGIAVNTIWPKTAINTAALRNNNLGNEKYWRKPNIIGDMVKYLVNEDSNIFTGHGLIDEDYLKTQGITDFNCYRCDPNHEPPELEKMLAV